MSIKSWGKKSHELVLSTIFITNTWNVYYHYFEKYIAFKKDEYHLIVECIDVFFHIIINAYLE